MKSLAQFEVWFVTGSQHLYGEETLEKVAETLEVSLLVRHALAVAASFHHLYHTHPILQAPSEESRRARRAALQVVSATLADLLDVLGVPVPERM